MRNIYISYVHTLIGRRTKQKFFSFSKLTSTVLQSETQRKKTAPKICAAFNGQFLNRMPTEKFLRDTCISGRVHCSVVSKRVKLLKVLWPVGEVVSHRGGGLLDSHCRPICLLGGQLGLPQALLSVTFTQSTRTLTLQRSRAFVGNINTHLFTGWHRPY